MSDIVERLRHDFCTCLDAYKGRGLTDPTCESCSTKDERNEAADTIEQLRRERDASVNAELASHAERASLQDQLTAANAEIARLNADCDRYRGEVFATAARTEAATRRAEEAERVIEKCREVLIGVEVFVKSKEQIKKPEGHAWFDEALTAIDEWSKTK